ncbi:MAG: lipoate--protein ligase family protein [Syntrophobacterales bacterium]|nr:MAG: lipoate--protein ligase family protein [Syntrophobacterales bacterium]
MGKIPGQQSMLIFHALARMGVEALVVVSPKNPLVSIGYFQDAEREIDLSFCRGNGIPFMRREVGGGATYLDENQIFYQLIWKRSNPRFPVQMNQIFGELSIPACETYRTFGIEASFREENDIVTRKGKKIAGEGGGDIGECMVFVGGILLDFDFGTMSKILRVPDEKFRDKVYKSMEENLTTMKRELGDIPPREEVVQTLIREFKKMTGNLRPRELDDRLLERMKTLEKWFTSDRFLFKKTRKIPKGIKIKGGVEIRYGIHKAKGGLIRTVEELEEEKINEIGISGDFQFYPKNDLVTMEVELRKTEFEEKKVHHKIQRFYDEHHIQAPGVMPDDFTTAIVQSQSEGPE